MNNAANNLPAVAIVGRPNVGKSAVFNRLIRRKIAIVHDQPGITRDRISAICTRGTRPFVVWDTGGIFGAGETELTAQVRGTAEEALRESDLLLFVVDAKEGLSPIDEELARVLRKHQKPVVLVINKIDAEKHLPLAAEFDSLGFKSSVAISAEHGRGLSDLLDTIDRFLPSSAGRSPAASQDTLAVAILGRPNVGKSSLINSIVRSERAIVSELAGTTRDAIDILYERNGRRFIFIDTAGIRRRGKQSTSAEIFSVMRSERSIRRADLCILIVDVTAGVTAQDKRIAGLIQAAQKPAIVILNKWDLVKPRRNQKEAISKLVEGAREQIFFLDYAPVLITSSLTGEHVSKLFSLIEKIRRAARQHIGTGVLNRLLRQAFEGNPPATISAQRLKLFYAAQAKGKENQQLQPPEFVLFVNDPHLLSRTYRRYLESYIRQTQPFPGLPILLTLRPRAKTATLASRLRVK
ncbi:MAG TPA: ribosome biogenesis GTPase Der [Candidatus Udaeobacter sp.]|nr:ribosome biogenesis GTPase Der [Candidatus Udaeobacter sp.]